MTRRMVPIVVALATALTAGCIGPKMDTPDGYVRLKNPGPLHDFKVLSADGVSLALRTEPNEENGTAEFWAAAVKNHLVDKRGYAFASDGDVTSADGLQGKWVEFTTDAAGARMGYLVAVWVNGRQVVVAEAGGPKEKFDADRARIGDALRTVRVR